MNYKMNENTVLEYENQLDFQKWAMRTHKLNRNLYYFDDVACVNAKTSRDIPGVYCDGSLAFGQAANKLIEFFDLS